MASPEIVQNYGWTHQSTGTTSILGLQILNQLRALAPAKVLDLGSGNGELCGYLHMNGFDIVGCEFDSQGIEVSRAAFPDIPFYQHGVQDDPALIVSSCGLFNAVVSTEVIEHLYSPQQLLHFSREVLVDHGYLLITTPYHGYLKNLALSISDKWDKHHTSLRDGGHIKFFSKRTLAKLLLDSGFDIVDFHGIGRFNYL
ncbi:class I SAM-dependent methyltransferase [Synechococcus sp. CS-1324]|uniref:class I SAM-dependent methyltransferase n=1 Tax=Synechococcus sp. CS-1324 TaxID=2847980 RepID=UPI000DB13D85|nr:class I SAM-dependent methyltransferase [Synechococcus sp. CS-1324]MCT0230735.1 class I SAM-dependent methyltransferase [Synechococcus sp. CS-1324]PZV05930.1 MAG: SAM-dependent methyltransferase [Cyanobium sp.]